MSTRSTHALASAGAVSLHLYHETHDDEVHLEIKLDGTNVALNLVIPAVLQAGITEILTRAGEDDSL